LWNTFSLLEIVTVYTPTGGQLIGFIMLKVMQSYKRYRIPKGQSKTVNAEKLATLDTQDEHKAKQKHNTRCVGNHYAQTNTHSVTKT